VDGGHPNQWGTGGAPGGSSVFPGWRPEDEADDWRTNIGVFAETEVNLSESVLANAAARFENYSDFGSNITGKLALRYQPIDDLIFRSSVSTGFRAPTLGQINWKHVSTGFQTTASGDQEAFEIGEFPVNAPEARALGARPLEDETSVNLAGGIAVTPANNFNITVDGYFIDVTDAIVLSGTIQGDRVSEVLEAFDASAIKYMTNAIDFQTKGVDVTASYRWLLAQDQFIEFTGAWNWNRVDVTGQINTPQVLVDLGEDFLSRGEIDEFENEKPKNKGVGTIVYRAGPVRTTIQGHWFGGTTELINTNPDELQDVSSEATFDAELQYNFDNGLSLSVGGENIFDNFPDLAKDGFDFLGNFPWATRIIGVNGRYIYTKVSFGLPDR